MGRCTSLWRVRFPMMTTVASYAECKRMAMTSPSHGILILRWCFPRRFFAEAFADHFRRLGYRVSVEETKSVPELPWDVVVVQNMIPLHSEISEFEGTLLAFA